MSLFLRLISFTIKKNSIANSTIKPLSVSITLLITVWFYSMFVVLVVIRLITISPVLTMILSIIVVMMSRKKKMLINQKLEYTTFIISLSQVRSCWTHEYDQLTDLQMSQMSYKKSS